MSIWEMSFQSDVDHLSLSPTETTHAMKVYILVFHFSCLFLLFQVLPSCEMCSCNGIFGCIKDPQPSGKAFTFSPMRKIWTIFPNLFLQQPTFVATLCQEDAGLKKFQLSLSPNPAKKSVYTFLTYCLNTSSFCRGRLLCSRGVPPLPPEQPDWSHH